MKRTDGAAGVFACIAMFLTGAAHAQACAEDVLRNLFSELEAIDTAGEERLKLSLDRLAAQESWSDVQRSDYTQTLADNPQVDQAESNRGSLIARLFSRIQRGDIDCAEIAELHAEVLVLEQAQWDAAVKQVEQRIFH